MSIGSTLIAASLTGLLGCTVMHYYIKYVENNVNQRDYQTVILSCGFVAFLTAETALILNVGVSSVID